MIRNQRQPLGAALLIFVYLLSPSCAGPGILTSLDDLTAHVDRQGLLDLQQQRVLSLSGLMPDSPPGAIYRYHGDRSPFTAVGISTEEVDAGSGLTKSFYERISIPYPQGDTKKLTDLRDSLISVREQASRLIRTRLDRLVALASEDTSGASSLARTLDSEEMKFAATLKDAQKMLDRPGLMIIRAETAKSDSLGARLSSILSLGSDSKEEKAGFAILAGLRTERLFVGSDLKADFAHVRSDWTLIGRKFPYVLGGTWLFGWLPILYPGQLSQDNFYVPTARLQANYILYAQDSVTERKIKGNLKATLEQLSELESISKAEEVEIDLILSSVASLGSSGFIGGGSKERVYLDQDETEASQQNWHTFYAVYTEFDDIDNMLSKNPLNRMHLFGFR